MRSESLFFSVVAGYLLLTALVYGWWTAARAGGLEWIGTIALALSGGLAAIIALYFAFVARRIDPRPEDRGDAEVAEGAGEVGFFSPGSYWPLGIGLTAALATLGVVLWLWWMIIAGLVLLLLSVGGLLFEYYTGSRGQLL